MLRRKPCLDPAAPAPQLPLHPMASCPPPCSGGNRVVPCQPWAGVRSRAMAPRAFLALLVVLDPTDSPGVRGSIFGSLVPLVPVWKAASWGCSLLAGASVRLRNFKLACDGEADVLPAGARWHQSGPSACFACVWLSPPASLGRFCRASGESCP